VVASKQEPARRNDVAVRAGRPAQSLGPPGPCGSQPLPFSGYAASRGRLHVTASGEVGSQLGLLRILRDGGRTTNDREVGHDPNPAYRHCHPAGPGAWRGRGRLPQEQRQQGWRLPASSREHRPGRRRLSADAPAAGWTPSRQPDPTAGSTGWQPVHHAHPSTTRPPPTAHGSGTKGGAGQEFGLTVQLQPLLRRWLQQPLRMLPEGHDGGCPGRRQRPAPKQRIRSRSREAPCRALDAEREVSSCHACLPSG
jgi:hypothetical protein